MRVLKAGDIISCTNIVFADGRADLGGRHPGIVLLPTDEMDDEAYCLYMTTDEKRARYEADKYVRYNHSFINLDHIIKQKNYIRKILGNVPVSSYISLLQKFYQYHCTSNNDRFEEIAPEIRTSLKLHTLVNSQIEVNASDIARFKTENISDESILASMLETTEISRTTEILEKLKLGEKRSKYITKLIQYKKELDQQKERKGQMNLNEMLEYEKGFMAKDPLTMTNQLLIDVMGMLISDPCQSKQEREKLQQMKKVLINQPKKVGDLRKETAYIPSSHPLPERE